MRPLDRSLRLPLASALASVLVGLALWASPAVSDDLKMVPAPSESTEGARPTRGMTMERVESKYGAPSRKVAPVGEPPIERWEYPSFTVYFEYRKVIHSVAIAAS